MAKSCTLPLWAMPGPKFQDDCNPKRWYDSLSRHAALVGPARKEISNSKVKIMAWTSPVFEEVVLCCEINSYVSAKL